MEEWRAVVGYEGWYEISSLGRVQRVKPGPSTHMGRILKPVFLRGYPAVALSRNGSIKRIPIHRLVADAFLGPRPFWTEVNHIDGIKTNSAIGNLEYVERAENQRHAYRLGLQTPVCGERTGTSKLTELEVLEIRNSTDRGVDLARRYEVSQPTISEIRHHRKWRHLGHSS